MEIKRKLSILVFLGLTASNAEASMLTPNAIAEATIDWSTFSVASYALGVGAAPAFTWSNRNTSLNPQPLISPFPNVNPGVSIGDWTSPLSQANENDTTDANLTTLHSYVKDTGSSSPFFNIAHWSTAERSGDFSVSGNGLLVFSANYALTVDAPRTSNFFFGLGSSSFARVDFGVNQKINSGDGPHFFAGDYLGSANTDPSQRSGMLQLALLVKDGEQFHFSASTNASASASADLFSPPVTSVPLPSAAWMFLSALVGFLGLSRRQSRLTA